MELNLSSLLVFIDLCRLHIRGALAKDLHQTKDMFYGDATTMGYSPAELRKVGILPGQSE